MNLWKRLLGVVKDQRTRAATTAAPQSQAREAGQRLQELLAEMSALDEPKVDGIETKEYYAHRACLAYARSLDCAVGAGRLSDADRATMERIYREYTSADYGAGLTFEHPWAARATILKEMYDIVRPSHLTGQPGPGAGKGQAAPSKPPVCDVCGLATNPQDGYALTTRQVVLTQAYWQAFFGRVAAQNPKALSSPNAAAQAILLMARQTTGWLVCEKCSPQFEFDPEVARDCARRRVDPPGSGSVGREEVLEPAMAAFIMVTMKH